MKKVLSLVLATVLTLGMSAVSFAKISDKSEIDLDSVSLGYSTTTSSSAPGGTYRPDDKVMFNIYGKINKTGAANGRGTEGTVVQLTRQDVRDLKLDIQVRASEGSSTLKSTKIEYKTVNTGKSVQLAQVELKFIETFVSTKEQDFDVELYLTSEKKRVHKDQDGDYRFSGTLENYYTDVDEYDDYVYAYDTPVIKAKDYIRNIKVDLGQNIAINAKMFDGKKYYGKVSQEIKDADQAVVAKYPDIQTVYYLQTIGLSSTGDVVSFYDLSDNYYVYVQNEDGNLVYIGRSNDKLPYFTKYFLSLKELPVDSDVEVPSEGGETPSEGPSAGGDEAPANINDNPSTGR